MGQSTKGKKHKGAKESPAQSDTIFTKSAPEGAAKKVSEDTRTQLPEVEWKKMTGMRDRLIHDYGGVDYVIVWDVATHKAPALAAQLLPIIELHGR